jgi:hypothetical protein
MVIEGLFTTTFNHAKSNFNKISKKQNYMQIILWPFIAFPSFDIPTPTCIKKYFGIWPFIALNLSYVDVGLKNVNLETTMTKKYNVQVSVIV